MKRLIWYILLGLPATIAMAQSHTFEVRSFKLLQNDITAYVDPVRDLNQEACALVKITGNQDFVFSAPLGIVQRREEVGEIWIYLPKSSRKMTIKHPRWGVLRDYIFPVALESRLTYELVLAAPVDPNSIINRMLRAKQVLRPLVLIETELPLTLPIPQWKRPKRPKEPLTYLAMINVSMYKSDYALGGMAGMMRRYGGYIRVLSNFRSFSTSLEANQQGILTDGTSQPYYTGKIHKSRHTFTIGGLHRLIHSLCLYEGVGYGSRTLAWETTEKDLVKIGDYSYQGVIGEIGVLWKGKKWTTSVGLSTINGSYWEMVMGVGMAF